MVVYGDETCDKCGQPADAGWNICSRCKKKEVQKQVGEDVYIDSMGIAWTQEEIEEAGGVSEIERMCNEADPSHAQLE